MRRLIEGLALAAGVALVAVGLSDRGSDAGWEQAAVSRPANGQVARVVPGSVYDGDTLRVERGGEEIVAQRGHR